MRERHPPSWSAEAHRRRQSRQRLWTGLTLAPAALALAIVMQHLAEALAR